MPTKTWIAANALGEAIGIAVVATIYAALERGVVHGEVPWILAAGAWEGLCLGIAQSLMLRRLGINALHWTGMTIIAATAGYGLSLAGGAGGGAEAVAEPGLLLIVVMGAGLGLFMGLMMGAAQWLAAPRRLSILRWCLANGLGWMPAMVAIMVAATSAGAGSSLLFVALTGLAAGSVAGGFVGIFTGAFGFTRPSKC